MEEKDSKEVKPESYYREPEAYIERAGREQNKDTFSEFLKIRDSFADRLQEDDVLLDAGCGPRVDASYFRDKVEKYVGVDISEKNIEYAIENEPGNFKVMDLRDLEFEDEYFDAIWNSASLFFMPKEDMETGLDEFSRVLAKEGIAFLSWKEGEGSRLKGDEEKVREYYITEDEAKNIVEKRFEILESFRNEGRKQDFISFIVRK